MACPHVFWSAAAAVLSLKITDSPTHGHPHIHTLYVHLHIYTSSHTSVHPLTCPHIHPHICTSTHMSVQAIHLHGYPCIHTSTHASTQPPMYLHMHCGGGVAWWEGVAHLKPFPARRSATEIGGSSIWINMLLASSAAPLQDLLLLCVLFYLKWCSLYFFYGWIKFLEMTLSDYFHHCILASPKNP